MNKPISLKNNIIVQELEKELLLYDLKRDKAFCLNQTSAIVWNLCDGEHTVDDIRHQLSLQLKTPIGEEIIWLTLHAFKKEKLLSNHQEIEINFNGLSRREVIRKVGLSTLAALPLILTITSPIPATAASQAVCGGDCLCPALECFFLPPFSPADPTPCTSGCTGIASNCLCQGPFSCLDSENRVGMCSLQSQNA